MTMGRLQYWKKRETQRGSSPGLDGVGGGTRSVDRAYPFGALFPDGADEPTCHVWLPNLELRYGTYDVVIVGRPQRRRRVILLLDDDVVLPVWHTNAPADRHHRPRGWGATMPLPADWRRAPVLVPEIPPVASAGLGIGGVFGVVVAAVFAGSQLTVVPPVVALAAWTLVAAAVVTVAAGRTPVPGSASTASP